MNFGAQSPICQKKAIEILLDHPSFKIRDGDDLVGPFQLGDSMKKMLLSPHSERPTASNLNLYNIASQPPELNQGHKHYN